MTYDERLSETIPLSKILDCFIEEDEKPSTIIWFLKDHESEIDDILLFSEYSDRLFFLDFIAKCSYDEATEIMRIMKKRGSDRKNTYLVWQILQSNVSERIKSLFRPYLTLTKPPRHPYAGFSKGSYIPLFDNLFKDINNDIYTIAENINRIKDDVFDSICSSFESSLFRNRVYQKDLFTLLDTKKQFLLLNEIKKRGIQSDHLDFFRKILISDIDVEIKYFIYEIISNSRCCDFKITGELRKLVDESVNFSQLMLKLDLYGVDNYAGELIFYLLYKNNKKWLFEIFEYSKDMLIENFNICDLIEKIKADGR